jgi:hypothetical protein
MAARRSGSSNSSAGTGRREGRGRGLVTMSLPLPRYVIAKTLASGRTGFYWNCPTYYRKQGCAIPNEPLGTDYAEACGGIDGNGGRAAALNAAFDEWQTNRAGLPVESVARFGTVDWLFREYKSSKAYLEKVARRSRPDYERTMLLVADIITKKGDRVGQRKVRAITPVSADRIYELIIQGPRGERLRQGEKAVALCRRAWRVVHRLYPDQFNRDVPNPWEGVTRKRRVAPAARERAGGPYSMDRLSGSAVPKRHPHRASQDRCGGVAPARGKYRSGRCEVLRGSRSRAGASAQARRSHDLAPSRRRLHEAIFVQRHAENRSQNARRDWVAGKLHSGCLSARGHDGT